MTLSRPAEQKKLNTLLKYISRKIATLSLPEYMLTEVEYILTHLNVYKLQNLKKNMRHLIAMLKKIHSQHQKFDIQVHQQVQDYLSYQHQSFTNKMRTLINLNVSELAHIAIEKHASPKSKTMHNSLKKYYNSIKLVQDMEQKDEL